MNTRSFTAPWALCTASLVVLAACGTKTQTLSVAANSEQLIDKVTSLSELSLGEDAKLVPLEGANLTMTVDGIGTAIKPGTYKGTVVLTPTEDVVENFNDMGMKDVYHYRMALYVEDGKRVANKSVASAIVGGVVTDTEAKDISITSNEDNFNGLFITGDSTYSISNAKITLTGNGGNDFTGFGAAIKTDGNAKVTVDNATINNTGVVRTAVFVGGNSVTNINNSNIEVKNGILPADYKGGPVTGSGGVMMEPPWVLGIVGNVRATNVVANGEAHYNNSHIKAQGWGALSTDATQDVKLYCKDSTVEVVESGYGAYADGKSFDTFSGCTLKVPDYGLVMTGGSGTFTDKSVVISGRNGVMMHSGGSGTLTIEKESEINAKEAVVQIKSSYPDIVVNNAKLDSESGVLIEAIVNDDPVAAQMAEMAQRMAAQMAAGGMGAAGPGGPGGPVGTGAAGRPGAAEMGPGVPGAPGGTGVPEGPSGPGANAPAGPKTISASFTDVSLSGDIVHSMTSLAGMTIALTNSTLNGAISTATQAPIEGAPTKETYKLVGRMKHTFGPAQGDNGLEVSLDSGSKWVVSKTSYLTGLTLAEGASVSAPAGYSVKLNVNGKEQPLRAGEYKGALVLKVGKG